MVEAQKRPAPRRKPFRAVTKTLEFVTFEPTKEGTLVLARDPWQFYRILIPHDRPTTAA